MAASGNKAQFIANLQTLANRLVQDKALWDDLVACYFDSTFQAGGAKAIVDADGTPYGLTAAQIAAGVTMMQQLQNFLAGSAVSTAQYHVTMQQIRTS